jgi:O-succinylbenzoic acid--CoA ligase
MDWLARQAAERPDALALIDDGAAMSYRELAVAAAGGAQRLDERGLGSGARLLWEARATGAGLRALHAALWVGATIAPFRPGLGRDARRALAERIGATGQLSADGESTGLPGGHGLAFEELRTGDGSGRSPAPADPDRVVTLLQTSGSGGPARLVPLRARHHAASARAVADRLGLSAADRWLVCLPLHHVGGLAIVWRATATGAALHLHERFDAGRVAAELDRGGITHLSLVPTQLRRLVAALDRPVGGSLRCVLVGGAAAEPGLLARAREFGLPAVPTWGMTEAGSQLATLSPAEAGAIDFAARPGLAGRLLDGVELRTAGTEACAAELEVRAPQLFGGYADSPGGPDGSGWFATGDRGFVDAEGRVRVVGRVGDRIITGGENVDALAVERALRESGRVDDVGVVGLPDEEWGERVAAVVVSRSSVEALAAWARAHLEPHQRPRQWRIVDRLPCTDSGKPDRAALVRLLQGDPPANTIE